MSLRLPTVIAQVAIAVAIVASIIFVGIPVNQATRAVSAKEAAAFGRIHRR